MNKIITLTGHKDCGKEFIAMKLAKNSDVAYIRPYTDAKIKLSEDIPESFGDYNYVSKETLDLMIDTEEVLSKTVINGIRFIFFKCQLTAPYNVLIVDDYGVVNVRENWSNVYSIKIWSEDQSDSDRVGVYLYDHEFDEVFHYGVDEYDLLEARIV